MNYCCCDAFRLQLQKFAGKLEPLEWLNVADVPRGFAGQFFMSTLSVQNAGVGGLKKVRRASQVAVRGEAAAGGPADAAAAAPMKPKRALSMRSQLAAQLANRRAAQESNDSMGEFGD